jgi:hypothetical protein
VIEDHDYSPPCGSQPIRSGTASPSYVTLHDKRGKLEVYMNEPRIRAASADDVSAITEIVDQAYRHFIARMGKPPGPMLDDYVARVSEGAVWVLEEGAVIAGIIVLLPMTNYLLLDNIAVSTARQGLGLGRQLLALRRPRHCGAAIMKSDSTRIKPWWRISASTLRSVMKRRVAASRPAMTASSCASSFADDDFVKQL